MPLTMAGTGEKGIVQRVGGTEEVRRFLASLGFVAGTAVTIVARTGGNLIVSIKDTRVAVNREMAGKIMI